MKITNTTIFMGMNEVSGKGDKKSIDGRLLQQAADPITLKRQLAQKKALGIVSDAFNGDQLIDEDLDSRREKIRALEEEKSLASQEILKLEKERANLREEYGVSEDSEEERQLRLLEKEMKAKMQENPEQLTDEERKEIAAIRKEGLTEYQERSLNLLQYEKPYYATVQEANKEIRTEDGIIRATRLERLKTHTMVDAQKEAGNVMDAASDEIVGMLMDEAKEHVDEEIEEKKEQAEKQEEKEEELQEKIDAVREEKKENEKLTEDILEGVQEAETKAVDLSAAKQEIMDMVNKMSLIEDDIKGAMVDENL